jgi:hypothetical protein
LWVWAKMMGWERGGGFIRSDRNNGDEESAVEMQKCGTLELLQVILSLAYSYLLSMCHFFCL